MAGPGPILYLDVDDEITSAAARMRSVEGTRVALVVPPGSRVATSRINFRLLAREAGIHGRRLAIIAPDAPSRALAAAAGLEVFASVADYEAAMGGGPAPGPTGAGTPDAGAAGGGVGPAAAAGAAGLGAARRPTQPPTPPPARPTGGTQRAEAQRPSTQGREAQPTAGADDLRPRSSAAGVGSVAAPRRTRFSGRALVAVLGLAFAGVLVVGGVVGYLLLPSATIVVTPKVESIGPVQVTVTADPDATTVDTEAGVVPAERLPLDVQAEGTYPATGERVVETKASGTVRFTNCDPFAAHRIDGGSRVATESGVAFTTDETILLPAAALTGPPGNPDIDCSERDVAVTAVATGTGGNVPANTITVVPGDQNPLAIRVTNRAPTEGGTRETFPRITEEDVTQAQADLATKLSTEFQALVADPDTAPPGSTLFPETAVLGEPVPEGDPAALVGQEVAEFTLSATASGTVIAVDETPVEEVAASDIEVEVDEGYQLVEGSVETRVGDPEVVGETVEFPATVTALQTRELDPAELEALVLGMTPEEATAALAPYGRASITITPDWATTIPTYDFRVDVSIAGAPDETPEASPEATPQASPSGSSPSPDAS